MPQEQALFLGHVPRFLCCLPGVECYIQSLLSSLWLCGCKVDNNAVPLSLAMHHRRDVMVESVHGCSVVLSDAENPCQHGVQASLCSELKSLEMNDSHCLIDHGSRRPVSSCGYVRSIRNATWLILPVVICLSQRLSHACVSMN